MRIPILIAGAVVGGLVAPNSGLAQSPIEQALGTPLAECRGAIARQDEGAQPRVEPLQIGVEADPSADAIASYAADKDFTAADVWACAAGLCAASRTMATGVTTSVLKLERGLDLGRDRVAYDVQAAFSIVSARPGSLEKPVTTGRGAFICDAALPAGVISVGE